MRDTIIQSTLLYVVLTVLTGLIYPGVVTVAAQLFWPHQADGSLIKDSKTGQIVGSELLGQEFQSPTYFWGRPSATSPSYNAGASSGSNLAPSNPNLMKICQARIDALKVAGNETANVPVDLVTASASGLDPHISPSAARFQLRRVATARGVSVTAVQKLIEQNTEPRQFTLLGEPRVSVVELNLALDKLGSNSPDSVQTANE